MISQNPAAGSEVARGSTVTITVSTGKPQVSVPDVVGMKEAKANSALSRAGLTPVAQEREVTDPGAGRRGDRAAPRHRARRWTRAARW